MSENNTHVNNYGRDFIYNIPQTVFLDLTLHLTDLRVYGIIRSFMDTTGDAYPSNGWLAKKLGVDNRTIRSSLAKLIKRGLVHRIMVDGKRHLIVGKSVPMAVIADKKPDVKTQGGGSTDPGGEDLQIPQLDQSAIDSNSNNSEPAPRKFRHAPALAEGDAAVAQILEKAAAYELPSKPLLKLVKKYGRGKVDMALDLLAKREDLDKIKNLIGWVTEAVKEDWVDDTPIVAPKPISPAIEAQTYLTQHRGTRLHADALLALDAEGIKEPLFADYKGQEYEIFFNDECKFNIKLVDKMKELGEKR